MTYLEVFEYHIKFDYDNASDRKFTKYVAADSVEQAEQGIEMIIKEIILQWFSHLTELERYRSKSKVRCRL